MFLSLVVLLLPCLCSGETLREAAQGKHFFMGAAGNMNYFNSPGYAPTLAAQYNLITAENACKWSATEPQQNRFNFSECDAHRDFARSAKQMFRGHNLCWGVYNPSWLNNLPPPEKKIALQAHIQKVLEHYGNEAFAWDVVNEAVSDAPNPNQIYKVNLWYPDVPDYVEFAFQTARKAAAPGVKLFYNDYNIASSTGWSAVKSQKVFDIVSDLKKKGLVDGVGLQLHVNIDYSDEMIDGVRQDINRYSAIGIDVHMTEIDIPIDSPTSSNLQKQAHVYSSLLKVCMETTACKSFESWGFTDKFTWLPGKYPLPFDDDYKPKPAISAMLKQLHSGEK